MYENQNGGSISPPEAGIVKLIAELIYMQNDKAFLVQKVHEFVWKSPKESWISPWISQPVNSGNSEAGVVVLSAFSIFLKYFFILDFL